MNIVRGRKLGAKKIVVYGPEGIGKSTFASRFPDPLFIDTEDSTKDMDVARFEKPTSWSLLLEQVKYVIQTPGICKTLVIDTADWAEMLEVESLCAKKGWSGLEDPGYGKGYTYSAEEFGQLLNLLTDVTEKGIHVVITAHAQLRKVELPEEMGAYDHWEMKTSKKVAPMIREWADAVFFATYKTRIIEVNKKKKAQGGERIMYTCHTPYWDAKNRYGMPEEMPFSYESVRPIIEETAAAEKTSTEQPEPVAMTRPAVSKAPQPAHISQPEQVPEPHKKEVTMPQEPQKAKEDKPAPTHADPPQKVQNTAARDDTEPYTPPDMRIPRALRDLMIADKITEWDIQNICEMKGYAPQGTPIWDYPKVNPPLIDEGIVANWKDVVYQIHEMNAKQELPW